MMLLLLFLISFLLMPYAEPSAVGSRTQLKEEDYKTEHVVTAVKFATNEINKQKLKNGEINECMHMNGKLLRGSLQIMTGTKYYLELKITPNASASDDCANKLNHGVAQLKPEVCEVEVLAHSRKKLLELVRFMCLQIED